MKNIILILAGILLGLGAVSAQAAEMRLQLHDGRAAVRDLIGALPADWSVPAWVRRCENAQINFAGLSGKAWVRVMNAALGDGCSLQVSDDALIVHMECAQLPLSDERLRAAVRRGVAAARPEDAEKFRRQCGLFLPARYEDRRPLLVLVHGLDLGNCIWTSMHPSLEKAGIQVAEFRYPNDGPIEESAALLADEVKALRKAHPAARVNLLTHSMGGLVARQWIESDAYTGCVDRLIEIAPPNHGSKWARYACLSELNEQRLLRRADPQWKWTQVVLDGLGEAGNEMKPGSDFLNALNARARRQGVAYTIIAGRRSAVVPTAQAFVDDPANHIKWQWARRAAVGVLRRVDEKQAPGDGVVSLESAALEGVKDFVVLDADHDGLCAPWRDEQPAALSTVLDRLK